MPPTEQEERLVTVYADIHYYFAPPTIRPILHRFDKASYFYIYYNTVTGLSRIEVANNPGQPVQDAFSGFLDRCRVVNSHKFPTLMTLEVDGAAAARPSSSQHRDVDPDEWRLASGDPKQTSTSKYRLHTLDVYFWAEEDAKLAIGTLQKLLQPDQLDIAELEPEPEPEPEQHTRSDLASPLVQNLEHVAISDPAYQNGQTRNSQNMAPKAGNLPPPSPVQPSHSVSPPVTTPQSNTGPEAAHNFTPMAYNPAAPAAPEPIAHREDTPPPPDDGHGTGLGAAARHDNVPYQPGQTNAPYSVGQPPQQSQPYRPGQAAAQPWTGAPPTAAAQQYPTSPYSSPPPHSSTLSYVPTNISTTQPTTLSHTSSQGQRTSIATQQYTPSPAALSHQQSGVPATTPGSQFYSTLPQPTSSPHKPLQHIQPQYPDYLSASTSPRPSQFEMSATQLAQMQGTGHPSSGQGFNYGAAQQQGMLPSGGGNQYDVHSQVYRPTEAESAHGHGHHGRKTSSSAGTKPGKEGRLEKGEKKVSGWMKKLENKVGL